VSYLLGTRFHKLAFTEFGNPQAPALLCVHGLTRSGRDFDVLAEALSDQFHVICPDLPGRGESDWLPEPMAYQPPSYVVALGHLLAYLNKPVAWLGTSLGGICGMMTAAAPGTPVTKLILNDVGALIPGASLKRIRDYMTVAPTHFLSLEAHLRLVHAPFGLLTDAQWAQLTQTSARALPEGGFTLHYDPRIIDPIRASMPLDVDLWPVWELIQIPRLVIRGVNSDLLLPDTFAQMQRDGAQGYEVPDAGHAPALMDAPSIARIREFLVA
jgi:pimeloyl-ACP methyl ester carboxylesterase